MSTKKPREVPTQGATPKAEFMRLNRESRKEHGLVECKIWIYPQDKRKLAAYVNNKLLGEYEPRL